MTTFGLSRNRTFVVTAKLGALAGVLFLVGISLKRINGLDPPYWVFWTGFFLQFAAFLLLGSVVLLVIRGFLRWIAEYGKRSEEANEGD